MSDLDRAVDARIDAHRPEHVPPFEAIKARRARRNRTRAAGAAMLSVVAVTGIAFGATTLGGGSPDRLPSYAGPADPPHATYVLRYERGYPYDPETDQAAVDACTALPGVGDVSEEQTLPPNYVVTVTGGEAAEAFTACASDLPGVSLAFLPSTAPWADALWEPPAFADRVRLPSCGAFEIVYANVPPEAIACMNRAVDGPDGAELALSLKPIDGDPVVTYTRVLPGDRGAEVFEDATRNQNGWILNTCAGFDPETGLGTGCQVAEQYPSPAPSVSAPASTYLGVWTGPDGTPTERGQGQDRTYELTSRRMPDHCDWNQALVLQIPWPLGSTYVIGPDPVPVREYMRDPEGVLPEGRGAFRSDLDLNATLPYGAQPTGYRLGDVELWLGPDKGAEHVYLVRPEGVERWPRAFEDILCA